MTAFIPEITTRVNVKVHSQGIDEALQRVESDPLLGQCSGLVENLQEKKLQLESLEQPVAYAIAQTLQSNQETIISTKHYMTGMMANSVEITGDGSDYLVGNNAASIDGFPYPLAIETGRREVYPVEKKVLRWFEGGMGGTPVFSKHSSAVPADPFVQPSIDETMSMVEDIVNTTLQEVLK